MDTFRDSSTINEHDSDKNENKDENTKQLPISDSKAALLKKKILAKTNQTLDFEKPPGLSRSCSFACFSRMHVVDARDDRSLPPYDPIENYISPRPKHLRFNPDRHNEILARQEKVSRMTKSVSFNCGVSSLEEVSREDSSVEETDDIVKDSVVSNQEGAKEEFDEVEDRSGWSRSVLLQYLIVVIVLILMTATICSMNSSTVSLSKVGYKGFGQMMLMDGNLRQLVERQHAHMKKGVEIKEERHETDDMETRQIEAEKESYVHTLRAYLGQNDVNKDDSDVIKNLRSMVKEETKSLRTKPEKESYFQIFGAVSGQKDVTEVSEVVKPTVEEDDSTLLSKFANVVPSFAAFSVVVVILACAGVLYYSIQKMITSAHKNKVSEESSSSVGSGSVYSSSHGSFTVEKMIVKKQRSKTPEVTISKVRRSSRIHNHNHNRSVTQSA